MDAESEFPPLVGEFPERRRRIVLIGFFDLYNLKRLAFISCCDVQSIFDDVVIDQIY